ncbi:hypothetical protein GCM10029976_042420 [Kribbella albertanoniae]
MYAFEIATRESDGRWTVVASGTNVFSRPPKATVRSLAERWIHEHTGRLGGGRLVIVGRRRGAPRAFVAGVRIQLLDRPGGYALATAYVGVDRRDAVRTDRDHYELPVLTGVDRDRR